MKTNESIPSSPSAPGRSARQGVTTEPRRCSSATSRRAKEEQHSIAPEYEARSKRRRYTPAECAELLDRADNPFFMFGIDAGRFQIWESYHGGLLSREDALDRLYKDRWGL